MTLKRLLMITACFIASVMVKGQVKQEAYEHFSYKTFEILLKNFHGNPADELYGFDWNNDKAHATVKEIPETYKIDLKEFSMPIKHSTINSPFGQRWGRNHNGVDLKANHGDTIYAAFHGKVRVAKYNKNGYGYYVVIRHLNGLETLYGHLSKIIAKPNQIVKAGDPIGLAGNTGYSTGVHLHFETRFCGLALNPANIFSFKDKDVINDYIIFKKNK